MADKRSPADNVAFLRRALISSDVPPDVAVAVAELIDHVRDVEAALSIQRHAFESSMKHCPLLAVLTDSNPKPKKSRP